MTTIQFTKQVKKKINVLTWYQIKKERGIKFVNNIKKLDWNSVIWNCKYITWSIPFFLEWFNILTVYNTIPLTFMSIATISIAPTPLKEYKNIICKIPAVKCNQYNIPYIHLQWIIESPSKWCWKNKEQHYWFFVFLLTNWWGNAQNIIDFPSLFMEVSPTLRKI